MHVTNVHAQKGHKAFNCTFAHLSHAFFAFLSALTRHQKARRTKTAAKQGKTKEDLNTRINHNTHNHQLQKEISSYCTNL